MPGDRFHLKTPEQDMSHYTFNTHRIKHYFCPKCGSAQTTCISGTELDIAYIELEEEPCAKS